MSEPELYITSADLQLFLEKSQAEPMLYARDKRILEEAIRRAVHTLKTYEEAQ